MRRSEAEIFEIVKQTFSALLKSENRDYNETHNLLLRTKIYCYLDTVFGENEEAFNSKYRELKQQAHDELPEDIKEKISDQSFQN